MFVGQWVILLHKNNEYLIINNKKNSENLSNVGVL